MVVIRIQHGLTKIRLNQVNFIFENGFWTGRWQKGHKSGISGFHQGIWEHQLWAPWGHDEEMLVIPLLKFASWMATPQDTDRSEWNYLDWGPGSEPHICLAALTEDLHASPRSHPGCRPWSSHCYLWATMTHERSFASTNPRFPIVNWRKHLPCWLTWRMKWDDERRMLGPVPETLQTGSQWSLSFLCGQR